MHLKEASNNAKMVEPRKKRIRRSVPSDSSNSETESFEKVPDSAGIQKPSVIVNGFIDDSANGNNENKKEYEDDDCDQCKMLVKEKLNPRKKRTKRRYSKSVTSSIVAVGEDCENDQNISEAEIVSAGGKKPKRKYTKKLKPSNENVVDKPKRKSTTKQEKTEKVELKQESAAQCSEEKCVEELIAKVCGSLSRYFFNDLKSLLNVFTIFVYLLKDRAYGILF